LRAALRSREVVEVGAMHLESARQGLVERLAEVERLLLAVIHGAELRAVLHQADLPHFLEHAKPLEQRVVVREQGFADVKARVAVLLEHHDLPAALREQRRDRGARRSTADHHDVAGVMCVSAHA
jgi:hypothetical protein